MKTLVSKKSIVVFLILSVLFTLAGAFFKILHWQLANIVLCVGTLFSIAFVVLLIIFFVKAKIK